MTDNEARISGLRINITIPVFERVANGEGKVDLTGFSVPTFESLDESFDSDDLMPVQGEGDFPDGPAEVERSIQRKARFQATVNIGHPADPLSYLGLSVEDENPYLDRNQLRNLMRVYAPEWLDKWIVEWDTRHHGQNSETRISFAGGDQDFIKCAKKNAKQSIAGETPEDVLLAWMNNPYFDDQRIKNALSEYKPGYRPRFR